MAKNYGNNVSRVLDATDTQYTNVIFQQGRPPLDAEFSLLQDLATDFTKTVVLRGCPSGWLGSETNPTGDFVTNATYSNWFKFGRQRSGEKKAIQWAVVNGWLVPVTGTKTGTPPGSPDDADTWNKVILDPPPSNSGDFRSDFVFLEVWSARIPPNPSSTNKPSTSAVYRYGNVEGGYTFLADDIQDPQIGFETTQRIQIQYRIRVVKGLVGLATNPDGFDPTAVKARGAATTDTAFTFSNMRTELGDPGLWRAGDGTANSLGTVDGYTYAIPLSVVFRRNAVAWNGEPSPNLNGAFNRNPTAVDRTGSKTFSTVPTLNATITATATAPFTAQLVSATNIPLPLAPATPVLIQIGDELLTYSSISTGGVLTIAARAQNGTVAEAHLSGVTVSVSSLRPDGLFSDQVAFTDILDVRHLVNPNGFDYTTLLKKNFDKLLKGKLRANWKRSGAGTQGPTVFYQDLISASAAVGTGITKLDAPDNIRTVFSDAAVLQKVTAIVKPNSSTVINPATATGQATWSLALDATILGQSVANTFTAADILTIPISQFKNTLPGGDADQVRFVHEVFAEGTTGESDSSSTFTDSGASFTEAGITANADEGDTLVVFSPPAAAGEYQIESVDDDATLTVTGSIGTGSNLVYEVRQRSGSVLIRVDGQTDNLPLHYYKVTRSSDNESASPGPDDDLKITFSSSFTSVLSKNLYIRLIMQYGAGRGLSRRPDSLHGVSILNGGTDLLLPPKGIPASNIKVLTQWAPLIGNTRNRETTFLGEVPTLAPAHADLGSKTMILTPFRRVEMPTGVVTMDGTDINAPSQGLMPLLKSSGAAKWTTTDPLNLFSGTTQGNAAQKNIYVTLPRELVPGWGAYHVPILPADSSTFSQGINYMLMAKTGGTPDDTNHSRQFINYANGTLTYAPFSTRNISVTPSIVSATYNAAFTFGGNQFAGIRFFTDTRGLGRKGLELPPFYGIARLFGVYEAEDYRVNGSGFNSSTRAPTGGGAKNLLRQSVDSSDGPTFWVELDSDLDSTFILNANAIDITKSTVNTISTFESGHYVVEASIFGFDRGAFNLTEEFRLVLSRNRTLFNDGSTRVDNVPQALSVSINTILPGPLPAGGSQALINYSRTPYQGDAFGSQSSYADLPQVVGPLGSSIAAEFNTPNTLDQDNLTRPNEKPLEVLACLNFSTTLGTGRIVGDLYGTDFWDFRNVGYDDFENYPPANPSDDRPKVLVHALTLDDRNVHGEYLGCTERLPMGALWRDKDFRGGTLQSSGVSGGNRGKLIFFEEEGLGSFNSGLARTVLLDQTEEPVIEASMGSGQPGEVLVHVDGENSNYSLLTNFRTLRGGSLFNASGDHPGGEFFSELPEIASPFNDDRTRVLSGKAMLVRNSVTSVGANEVSAGDELMMLIVTSMTTPGGINGVLIGTDGVNEGGGAADLYRIEGRPLVVDHSRYEVDPSTIELAKRI